MNALLLQTMCESTIKNKYKLQRGKDYDFHSFLICSLFSQFFSGSNNYIKTFAISEDLTNSPHFDFSDNSHSLGLWYPTKKGAKTWFLIPKASLAIECASRPFIVCWDGREHQHCSCTVGQGMISVCGIGKKNLAITKQQLGSISKKRKTTLHCGLGQK